LGYLEDDKKNGLLIEIINLVALTEDHQEEELFYYKMERSSFQPIFRLRTFISVTKIWEVERMVR